MGGGIRATLVKGRRQGRGMASALSSMGKIGSSDRMIGVAGDRISGQGEYESPLLSPMQYSAGEH